MQEVKSEEKEEDRIIRFPELQRVYGGASRTSIWRWEKAGLVPKRIKIGPRSVGWIRSEVIAKIKNLKQVHTGGR